MKVIVTIELDLMRAIPNIHKQFEWKDLTDAELLEAVADYFGDTGGDTLLKDQFLDCFEGVKNVERIK